MTKKGEGNSISVVWGRGEREMQQASRRTLLGVANERVSRRVPGCQDGKMGVCSLVWWERLVRDAEGRSGAVSNNKYQPPNGCICPVPEYGGAWHRGECAEKFHDEKDWRPSLLTDSLVTDQVEKLGAKPLGLHVHITICSF